MKSRTFNVRKRFLIDIILITDVALIFLYALTTANLPAFIAAGVALNFLQALIWFVWVAPVLKVQLNEQEISGPSQDLKKTVIPLAKVDKWRTETLRASTKKKGYVDIYSFEGSKVRLIRPVLGRGQCYIILESVLGNLHSDSPKIIVPYPNE